MAEAIIYTLKITSAVAIDGAIRKAGSLVDVDEAVAKNLLHRGKALVATVEDAPQADTTAPADTAHESEGGDESAEDTQADAQEPAAKTGSKGKGKK